ncbi:MAG: hypothetical protein PWQ43_708 [Rikenellaceae bacterium]|jgi:hypothetical protein|nr:hypothetical protein [Rikenellaceae bacterium]MDN5355766.1 hypothetical protein [Rikenellaceae bacterium]
MNKTIQASQTLENYKLPDQIDLYKNLIKSLKNEFDKKYTNFTVYLMMT